MRRSATLKYVIDVRHGLLDDLFSAELLNDDEMEQILSETKESEAVDRLMQYYAKMPRDQQQQFREHLDRSGQAHVTQFIVRNGQRPTDNNDVTDVWPLYDSREWNRVKCNRSKLIELTDSRHGLVDEMMQEGCLNRRQYDALNSEREDGQRNTKLLNILQRKSLRDFVKFLRCLEKTEQHHVVGILDERNDEADAKPLCEQQKSRITANLTYLIDNIETVGRGLLSHLLSSRCITLRQKGYVESASGPADGNRRLLQVMQRSSQKKFDSFVNCLNKTGQQHLATVLNHDGVVAQIVATLSGTESKEELAAVERRIVDEFKGLLAKSDGENRQKLLKKIFEPVELVGLKTKCSIKLFFFCHSLFGLQYLNDLYTSDELCNGVVDAFNILLCHKNILKVDRLMWELSDYERCVTVLSKSGDHLSPTHSDERKGAERDGTSELHGSKNEHIKLSSLTLSRLSKSIKSKRSGLLHLIDIHHGLLSHLREAKTLSEEQVARIFQKGTEVDQVGQLLDEVVSLSGDGQERFMVALKKTRQQHVVDRIMDDKTDEGDEKNDGKPWRFSKRRNRATEPSWPLLYTQEWAHLDRSWCQFLDTADCVCGLLEELVQRGCINQQHLEDIKSTPIQSLQNLKLLQIFRRKSVGDFHKLLESLKATKQYYIESLLNPRKDESVKPLTEIQKMALHANKFALIEIIDAKSTESNLLDEMLRCDCITRRQNEFVKSAKTVTEANERLLKILEYGCQTDFSEFIDVLRQRKQYEACSLLNGEGVCACIQAVTVQSGTCHFSLTCNVFDESPIGLKNVTTADAAARRRMIQLIATRTCGYSSLRIFLKCRTPDEILFLRQTYGTRVLKLIIKQVLAVAYNTKSIEITTIEWTLADYLLSVSSMYEMLSLNCHAKIYRLAVESKDSTGESTNWKHTTNQLPFEMVQYVLVKALGRLFHHLRAKTSHAELLSIVSVMSVCRNWWDEVGSWKSCKHRVKRSLKTFCYPYRPTVKEVKRIEMLDDCFYGIAQYGGKIYVLDHTLPSMTTILVFVAMSPYSFLYEIAAPIILAATDIVASNTTGQLYLSGYLENCIWRINTDGSHAVERFTSVPYAPWTLSMKNERLLVTFHGGSNLMIYNSVNGNLVSDIVLPTGIYAYHAKELIDGTIVVCHRTISTDLNGRLTGHNGISQFTVARDGSTPMTLREFNSDAVGDVIRSTPYHLATDRAGDILLADRSEQTVIQLKKTDKSYQTNRVLVCSTGLHPKRICYSDDTKLLCVCFYDVNSIRIYKV